MKKFVYKYLLVLIFAFLLQDILVLFLINIKKIDFIFLIISFKEVLLGFFFLFIFLFTTRVSFKHFFNSQKEAKLFLLFIGICILYIVVGLGNYPAMGVVYEGRAIFMPIILYMFGSYIGYYLKGDSSLISKLVGYIKFATLVFAFSAVIDYFFIPVSFWENIGAGDLDTVKGGFVSAGALPDNFYSIFGRRALGLAINPLLLSYLSIPGLVFFYFEKSYLRAIISYLGVILTFSRLPILSVLISLGILKSNYITKIVVGLIGTIVFVVYMDRFAFIFSDASASGHYSTFGTGLSYFLKNPLGYGVGSAGVFAYNYSDMYAESAILNLLNQIGLVGFIVYLLVLSYGLSSKKTMYYKEMRLMALIYFITAILSPQIFVIKASFIFFIFLGINKKLEIDVETSE